jgi:hypothetical protein
MIDYTFLEAQESQGVTQSTDTQLDPNEGPLAQSPSAQAADGPPQPVIVMPEVEFLAGEVDPSSTISHEFLVKNEGPGDLVIDKVVPGCGCSVASFTSFIPPGAEGKVYLTVDIYAEWAGHNVNKSAVVMSNDPINPDIRVTIRAKVRDAKVS